MRYSSRHAPARSGTGAAAIVAIALCLLLPRLALASGLSIQCTELSSDQQAALATRLRADLAVRPTAGHLAVECGQRDGWILWTPDEGRSLRQPVTFDASGHTVDRILEALDRVFKQADHEVEETPTAAAAADAGPLAPMQQQSAPPPERPQATWLLAAGARLTFWSKQVIGVAGPHLVAGALLGDQLRLSAEGGARWGLRSPRELSAFSWDARLGADWRIGPVDLGGGLRAAFLQAQDSVSALEDNQTTFGADIRVRAAVPLGPILLRAGPELLVNFEKRTRFIRNGSEVFDIPRISGALSLDFEVNGRSVH